MGDEGMEERDRKMGNRGEGDRKGRVRGRGRREEGGQQGG